MDYLVVMARSAEKELDALPASASKRLAARLLALELDPRPPGLKPLLGSRTHRLQAGNYRLLYTIDDIAKLVTVLSVGDLREVYRSASPPVILSGG